MIRANKRHWSVKANRPAIAVMGFFRYDDYKEAPQLVKKIDGVFRGVHFAERNDP